METPERLGIVPTVVEEERIELHATPSLQLFTERRDHGERFGLVELREVPEVVPGVVVKERPVRVRALALEVRQKVAPQLASARRSDDRRQRERGAGTNRKLTRERRASARACYDARGKRMFDRRVPSTDHERTSPDGTVHDRVGAGKIDQDDLANDDIARNRAQRDLLPHIARAVAQFGSPLDAEPFGVVLQLDDDLPSRESFGEPRCAAARGDRLDARGLEHTHVAGANRLAVGEHQREYVSRELEHRSVRLAHTNSAEAPAGNVPLGHDRGVGQRQVLRPLGTARLKRDIARA